MCHFNSYYCASEILCLFKGQYDLESISPSNDIIKNDAFNKPNFIDNQDPQEKLKTIAQFCKSNGWPYSEFIKLMAPNTFSKEYNQINGYIVTEDSLRQGFGYWLVFQTQQMDIQYYQKYIDVLNQIWGECLAMEAVVLKGKNTIGIEEVSTPVVTDGSILVRVLACGICGSDLRIIQHGNSCVSIPTIIGHEICAEVVQIGKNVDRDFKVGDRLAIGADIPCGKCHWCQEGNGNCCRKELCNWTSVSWWVW